MRTIKVAPSRTEDGRRCYVLLDPEPFGPFQAVTEDGQVIGTFGASFIVDPPLKVAVEVVPGDEEELLDALADYLIALANRQGRDE